MASPQLVLVEALDEVAANARRFLGAIRARPDEAKALMRQTTYWVHNPVDGSFTPSKWAGFKGMDSESYLAARSGTAEGARFDGHLSRGAVEALLGPYKVDAELATCLKAWSSSVLGPDCFENVTATKWQFVSLPGRNSGQLERGSVDGARRVIERLVPDPEERRAFLEAFAGAIVHANGEGQAKWGITLYPDCVRLNVGPVVVASFESDGYWLCLDANALGGDPKDVLRDVRTWYSTLPDAVGGHPAVGSLPVVAAAHYQLIGEAAAKVTVLDLRMRRAHSPGVLAYLAEVLGRPMPNPLYPSTPPANPTDVYSFLREKKGLHFPDELVTTYLLSLMTKPFVILSGISGTGKTKLAQAVAEWAGSETLTVDEEAPAIGGADGGDVWTYQLQPYNFRYRKIVIASEDHARLFDLPEQGSRSVAIRYGTTTVEGTLGCIHPAGRTLHELRLGAPLIQQLQHDGMQAGRFVQISVENTGVEQTIVLTALNTTRRTRQVCVRRHDFISVRPDWLDAKGCLGFYNLLSERYVAPPFVRRLLAAFREPERAHFVILDEMNLSRVEHYFSDLLSALESRQLTGEGIGQEPIHLHDQPRCLPVDRPEEFEYPSACTSCPLDDDAMARCRLHPDGIAMVPPRLKIPLNVYVTGTVNVDETTHMFSAKVLDRASVIEFNAVRLGGWSGAERQGDFRLRDDSLVLGPTDVVTSRDFAEAPATVRADLQRLNALLESHNLHFGYRVANEIGGFVANAVAFVGPEEQQAALDLAILQKVLPKLHGTKQRLLVPLQKLLGFAAGIEPTTELTAEKLTELEGRLGDLSFPRSAAKLLRMIRRLQEQGFVSFIE